MNNGIFNAISLVNAILPWIATLACNYAKQSNHLYFVLFILLIDHLSEVVLREKFNGSHFALEFLSSSECVYKSNAMKYYFHIFHRTQANH